MENTSSLLLEKTLGPRLFFYLVFPSEATYQRVNEVPKYTQLVNNSTHLSPPYSPVHTQAIPHFLAMIFIEVFILYAQNKRLPPVDDTINSMTHGLLLLVSQ